MDIDPEITGFYDPDQANTSPPTPAEMDVRVAANSIGWDLYHGDGRPVRSTVGATPAQGIYVSTVEQARALGIAEKALRHVAAFRDQQAGYSPAVFADDTLERGVRRLLTEVDRAVKLGHLDPRNPVADATLDLAQYVGYEMGTADTTGRPPREDLNRLLADTDPAADFEVVPGAYLFSSDGYMDGVPFGSHHKAGEPYTMAGGGGPAYEGDEPLYRRVNGDPS